MSLCPVEPLSSPSVSDGARGSGGGGFTAALQNLAAHTDAATTRATAKMIGYPTTHLELPSGHLPWRTVLLASAVLALAVLIGRAPARLARRWRRRFPRPDGASPGDVTTNSTTAPDVVTANA
jgi:hypothetical protein